MKGPRQHQSAVIAFQTGVRKTCAPLSPATVARIAMPPPSTVHPVAPHLRLQRAALLASCTPKPQQGRKRSRAGRNGQVLLSQTTPGHAHEQRSGKLLCCPLLKQKASLHQRYDLATCMTYKLRLINIRLPLTVVTALWSDSFELRRFEGFAHFQQ